MSNISFGKLETAGKTTKRQLHPLIPMGDYCYSYTGKMLINDKVIGHDGEIVRSMNYYAIPETKKCPFWNKLPDDGAYCSFLEHTSGVDGNEDSGFDLLWDQIKECGVNLDDSDILDDPINYPVNKDKSDKYIKRTPHLLRSIVVSMLDNNMTEFKFDGTTYVLSQSIIDELGSDYNPTIL